MRLKRLIAKASTTAPPWITRACANFMPIAEIVEQDNITRDDTDVVVKKSKKCTDEKTVVETTSDGVMTRMTMTVRLPMPHICEKD